MTLDGSMTPLETRSQGDSEYPGGVTLDDCETPLACRRHPNLRRQQLEDGATNPGGCAGSLESQCRCHGVVTPGDSEIPLAGWHRQPEDGVLTPFGCGGPGPRASRRHHHHWQIGASGWGLGNPLGCQCQHHGVVTPGDCGTPGPLASGGPCHGSPGGSARHCLLPRCCRRTVAAQTDPKTGPGPAGSGSDWQWTEASHARARGTAATNWVAGTAPAAH